MKNKNKKLITLFLALILILIQVPIDKFQADASGTGIIVRKVKISENKIREGDSFLLELVFENKTGRTVKNPMVEVNKSDSFSLKNIGSKKSINFDSNNESKTVNFELIYKGKEDTQLPITIHYSIDNENFSLDDYVSIPQAKPTEIKEEKPEEPIDKTALKPNLALIGNRTTNAKAGERLNLDLRLKNTSDARAYNISASLNIDEDSGIFIAGSGLDEISSLSSGDDKRLSYRIEVDEFTQEKTYPLKVNIDYYNKYDIHFSKEETVYVRVKGDGQDKQVVIEELTFLPEGDIKPGDQFMARFKVKNLSLIPVRDLDLSLEGLSKDGFTLASGTNKKTISLMPGRKTEYISFPIRASRKISSGNHPLKLKISYKNLRGNNLEAEEEFFLPIKRDSMQNSSLIMENMKAPRLISAGSKAQVSFSLRNRGQTRAMNIKAIAELADLEGLIPSSPTTLKEDSLDPGESKTFVFNFDSTKKSASKNYPINIKVSYTDNLAGDEDYELDQTFLIFLDNPALEEKDGDGKKSKPKLIIDKYSFSTNMVEAGQNFEMKLSFYNTNKSKSVSNIKIFLTSEENVSEGENTPSSSSSVFTPVNSSNTFYIDHIPPKGRVEKSITMFTIPNAAAKTHVITANLEYEDGDFDEYKAEELIGVPVVQKSKLEISEINFPTTAFTGEEISISSEFYNKGKSTLYNMLVRMEGNFQSENSTNYIGNFQPGTSEFFEASIFPEMPGLLEGKLIFSFEDSRGEEQVIEEPFSIQVEEGMMDDDFPEEPMEDQGGIWKKLKYPLFGLIFLAAGIGARKVYKKRKAKKDEEDLLSDE